MLAKWIDNLVILMLLSRSTSMLTRINPQKV